MAENMQAECASSRRRDLISVSLKSQTQRHRADNPLLRRLALILFMKGKIWIIITKALN